jgi:hypothetical protein
MDIIWDGQSHIAHIVSWRANHHIRYQFLKTNGVEPTELSYLEFKTDFNEITQTSFLRITDYSDMDNDGELQDLWDNLIEKLREVLGANAS